MGEFSTPVDPGANLPTPQPLSIGLSGPLFAMSGTLSELNLFNLIQGSANFAIQVNQDVSVTIPVTGGTTTTLSGATLFQLGLGHISALVGAGGFGLNVTAGNLGIAVVEPPAPASGTDSRYWIGVDANSLQANLALGGVTASVQSLNLDLNQAGGVDPNNVAAIALDWMQPIKAADGTTITVDPGQDLTPSVSLAINYSQGPVFSIGATAAAVNIFNIITGSADFALSRSTTNVSFTGAAPASLMRRVADPGALSNLNLNIGVSGFGLSVTGGDIGPWRVRAPTPAAGSDSRYWVAVDATNLSGLSLGKSLSPGSSFTAEVTNLADPDQPGGWLLRQRRDHPGRHAARLDQGPGRCRRWPVRHRRPTSSTRARPQLRRHDAAEPPDHLHRRGVRHQRLAREDQAVQPDQRLGRFRRQRQHDQRRVQRAGQARPDRRDADHAGALSNLNIAVGATGFGLEITGGELGIAAIEAPTPQSGTDSRYWIAVDGMNLAATLAIGSSITGEGQQPQHPAQPGRRHLIGQRRGHAARLGRRPRPRRERDLWGARQPGRQPADADQPVHRVHGRAVRRQRRPGEPEYVRPDHRVGEVRDQRVDDQRFVRRDGNSRPVRPPHCSPSLSVTFSSRSAPGRAAWRSPAAISASPRSRRPTLRAGPPTTGSGSPSMPRAISGSLNLGSSRHGVGQNVADPDQPGSGQYTNGQTTSRPPRSTGPRTSRRRWYTSTASRSIPARACPVRPEPDDRLQAKLLSRQRDADEA